VPLEISVRTSAAASVIALVICAAMFQSRPPPVPALRPLGEVQAHEFYDRAAEAEGTTRKASANKFRGSPWSQDDDFHNKEAKFVRGYSKSHGVTIASLLDVLDRGSHAHWATPAGATVSQKIIPCRPRLSY